MNHGTVMEELELAESVESHIFLHYAGPKCGLAMTRVEDLDGHAMTRETTRSVVGTWVRG